MNQENEYRIWGADNVVYGPVELPGLVDWVREKRVQAGTWVFDGSNDRWRKAASLPELQMFFGKKARPGEGTMSFSVGEAGITAGMMRQVKVLAGLTDEQLARFADYTEGQTVAQWTPIVKQGDPEDGMYLVLSGELRVRLMIGGKETILATLGPGDCFGEMALVDQGVRSADVLTNQDSILLKISSEAFDKLRREAAELAAPILFAVGKTLAARIRADNKRTKDSISLARAVAS